MKNLLLILILSPLYFFSQNKAPDIYKKNNNAVVKIITYHNDNSVHGQASGVILKQYGWVVTNLHIVGDAHYYTCQQNGKQYKMDSVIAFDSKKDILVLKIAPDLEKSIIEDVPEVKIAKENEMIIGEEVFAIGSPLGFENTITNGLLNGIRINTDSSQHYIQISAPLSSGSSGGAVFNSKGKLIGISTMVMKGEATQNINFAILIEDVIETATKRIKSGDWSYGGGHGGNHTNVDYFSDGYSTYLKGYYLPAINSLRKSLENPMTNKMDAFYLIGDSYRNLEMFDSAFYYLMASNKIKPNVLSYLSLSEGHWQKRDTTNALRHLNNALKIDKTNANAIVFKAEILFIKGFYTDALTSLQGILSIYPKDPRISTLLGFVSIRLKDYALAENGFKFALTADPHFAKAQLGMSKVLKHQKKFDLSVMWEKSALEIDPSLKNSYFFGVD